jgi:signal transduction histidine kinase
MRLQRKFAVLLAVLTLAVLANLATAAWAIWFLERQVAAPWADIQRVQRGLNEVKRAASDQASLIAPEFPINPASAGPSRDPVEVNTRFLATDERITQALGRLVDVDVLSVHVGAVTSRNLQARVAAARQAGRVWLDEPSEANRTAALQQYFRIHELIQTMEAASLRSAVEEVSFGRSVRSRLLLVLAASLMSVLLAGLLGVTLIRRWILKPVRRLRDAADRLSKGDFAHRVPVEGRDELGELSAEINHMAGMISTMQEERVERERLAAVGEMVRRLAHNLRNPLAGIRSLAELSRADLPEDSAVREAQGRIVETVDRFERWLKELLSASTPQAITPSRCEVAPWLAGVLDALRPLASSKDIRLDLHVDRAPETADFDPRHLEQAVVSLLTNAIQASPRGRPIVITTSTSEEGRSWDLRIQDEGPGVPPDLVDKIFRPYFTTKRDGTGIGLAVAKQVVEQHGGRIWVERGPSPVAENPEGKSGPGSTFIVRLPLARIGHAGVRAANDGHAGGSGGQGPDRRRRGEPEVLHPADAQTRRT